MLSGMFESSVISYGSKAKAEAVIVNPAFESSVISYGSKAIQYSAVHIQ